MGVLIGSLVEVFMPGRLPGAFSTFRVFSRDFEVEPCGATLMRLMILCAVAFPVTFGRALRGKKMRARACCTSAAACSCRSCRPVVGASLGKVLGLVPFRLCARFVQVHCALLANGWCGSTSATVQGSLAQR